MPQSIPICHNCSKKYTKDGSSIPLLLKCGHTFCEACILRFGRLIKNYGNIICPECQDNNPIESVKCIKQMPINSHIYGIISAPNRKTENAVDTMVNDLTNKLSDIAVKQYQEGNQSDEEDESDEEYPNCCECNSRSDITCKSCDLDYCQNCSDQAHKLVALRDHCPEPVQPKSAIEPCPDHPEAKPSHILLLSGMPVCPECPAPGNTAPILCEPEHMEDMVHLYNVGLEKTLESDQCISELIPVVEEDFLRLKTEVRKEFGYIHGILQAREQFLLDALDQKQIETVQPLLDSRCEVARTRKTLRSNFNWVLRNKTRTSRLIKQQLKVHQIKKDIEEAATVFCIKSEKKPTYVAKKDILKTCIEEFSFLNLDNIHQYVLAGSENKELRRYREEDNPGGVGGMLQEDDMLWNNSAADASSILPQSQPVLDIKPSFAESKELVTVSCIYDPHCFYIQRTKDRDTLDELQNILVKYYGLSVTPEDYIKHVSVGDMVCCQYSEDDLWYRARVITYGNSIAKMCYVDYGNTEEVPIKKLRQLKPQFCLFPALAIQCKIPGIKPRNNDEWSSEAIDSFRRLTYDREFELVTKSKQDDAVEADLRHCGGEIGSIRELLVFLEHAVFSIIDQQSELVSDIELSTVHTDPISLTWPQGDESEDQYVDVMVSHIEHPSLFYIQLVKETSTLQTIEKEINNLMETIKQQFPLKSLKKGTMCLAQFQDNNLYRGIIKGMVQFNVELFYCDYGNTDYIPRNALYEIPANIAQYPMQALKCALHGVAPIKGGEWTESNKLLFDKLAYTQSTVFAKLEEFTDNIHKVSLVDTNQGSLDIDIGSELISNGAARSTIENSEPGLLKLGDINTTLDVTLCNVESLHCIYVNPPQVPYPEFFQRLNVTYNSLAKAGNPVIEPVTEWKVGDICVAFVTKLKVYIRAKVVEINGQDVKVENIDQGKITETTLSNLKNLIEDFRSDRKFAVKCDIYDVLPHGEGWSEEQNKLIYRFFNRKIRKEKATCYVTVKGQRDPVSKSWPVDMVLCNPRLGYRIRVSEEFIKAGIAVSKMNTIAPVAGSYKKQNLSCEPDIPLHVNVSHVTDDCIIFVQPIHSEPIKDVLQRLKNEITKAISEYKAPETDVMWSVGSECSVHFCNKYYRGVIVKVMGEHLLEVQFVDIGSRKQIPKHSVYPITVSPDTPLLALPCNLVFVQPSWYQGDGTWSKAAAEFLYEKLVNETCQMRVMSVDTTDKKTPSLSVNLKLKTGEDISETLVSRGFALYCGPVPPKDSTCVVSQGQGKKSEDAIQDSKIDPKIQVVSYDLCNDKDQCNIEISEE